MNVLLLTGTHPRHTFMAEQIDSTENLAGLVLENRGAHVPPPPEHLGDELRDLYEHHFRKREEAENVFFGDCALPLDQPRLEIERTELNGKRVHRFIEEIDPDLAVTYGVHKLSEETLDLIGGRKWNIHGGLSPKYRGVITHFWPNYLLEPQMTGVTLHELTSSLDAGDIVHQTPAPLVRDDGIHELACRTVNAFGEELVQVLRILNEEQLKPPNPQMSEGKLWIADDWRPDHLRVIYQQFDNDIVNRYLNGEFTQQEPDLFRQFEDHE